MRSVRGGNVRIEDARLLEVEVFERHILAVERRLVGARDVDRDGTLVLVEFSYDLCKVILVDRDLVESRDVSLFIECDSDACSAESSEYRCLLIGERGVALRIVAEPHHVAIVEADDGSPGESAIRELDLEHAQQATAFGGAVEIAGEVTLAVRGAAGCECVDVTFGTSHVHCRSMCVARCITVATEATMHESRVEEWVIRRSAVCSVQHGASPWFTAL